MMLAQQQMMPETMKTHAEPTIEALPEGPASREIETRFGPVTIHKEKAIHFANGLLGMPDKNYFCLTDFPITKLGHFKLLQCLNDDTLAFIALPIAVQNDIVAQEDIEEACKALDIGMSDLALLLIVSVHRRVDAVTLSVNARAPVFIDAKRKKAAQYVFPNSDYAIRHMIPFKPKEGAVGLGEGQSTSGAAN